MKLCSNCRFVYYMVMNRADAPCVDCIGHDKWQTAKPNNYDRIHAMNEEEFAQWLCDVAGWLPTFEGRVHPILEWLRQEAIE